MRKLKVQVDRSKCIGSGQCVFTAPEVFDQGEEDGIVRLISDEPDLSLSADAKAAERNCPASAIRVEQT